MKKLILLLFTMAILGTSCSKDDPTEFAGTYTGFVSCTGDFEVDNESTTFIISKNADDSYTVIIDGESTFTATANDNVLTIANQTPVGADFEPFLAATITENEDGSFSFVGTVNEDGDVGNCTSEMTRQ